MPRTSRSDRLCQHPVRDGGHGKKGLFPESSDLSDTSLNEKDGLLLGISSGESRRHAVPLGTTTSDKGCAFAIDRHAGTDYQPISHQVSSTSPYRLKPDMPGKGLERAHAVQSGYPRKIPGSSVRENRLLTEREDSACPGQRAGLGK